MRWSALALGAVVACAIACSDSPTAPGGAQFRVRDVHAALFRVRISDDRVAREARELQRSGAERWVTGVPARGDGGFNRPWSWHLDPATIEFAEVTAEACQTTAGAIGDDLDYWLRFGRVCIGSRIEAEED